MKMHSSFLRSFTLMSASITLLPVASTSAATYTTEHVDLALRYPGVSPQFPSGWELYFNDRDDNSTAPLAGTVVSVLEDAAATRPAGSQWDFLGVAAGQPVFILPQSQDATLVFLGIGAEQVAPGSVTGSMQLSLASVTGPGQFSLYQASGQTLIVSMASANGITPADSVGVPIDSHIHYNWAFTAPGQYTLGFRINGTPTSVGQPVLSEVFNVQFSVVPEPGVVSLLAGAGVLALRRKR